MSLKISLTRDSSNGSQAPPPPDMEWPDDSALDQSIPDANDPEFKEVIKELQTNIKKHSWNARIIFGVAVVALVYAFWALPYYGSKGAQLVQANPNAYTLFVYEMVRTAALAAVITAAVWGLFNLGRAALDQSVRYEKRLIAAHFLNFILHAYQRQIRLGRIKLPEVMAFLRSWSANVESAFTHVRFGSKKAQEFAISAGKDGVAVASGKAELPKLEKSEE